MADGGAVVVQADITELKRSERMLATSERMFATMLKDSPIAVTVIRSPGNRIAYANDRMYELFRIDHESLRRRSPKSYYVDPKDAERMAESLKRDGYVHGAELRLKRGDGTEFWASATFMEIDYADEPGRMAWYYDITDRKRAEAVQWDLLDDIPAPIIVSSSDTHEILFANRHATQAYGYGGSPVGRSVLDDYEEPQRRLDLVERLRSGGGVEQFEARLRNAEGELQWTLISAQSIRYQDRDAVLVVSQDIDEIKRLERALEESEEQQRDILEESPIGIVITNRDNQVLFRNRLVSEMGGVAHDEEPDLDLRSLYTDPADYDAIVERLRTDGLIRGAEIRFRRPDGTLWWGLVSIQRKTFEGQTVAIAWTLDITERKRAEAVLQDLLDGIPVPIVVSSSDTHEILFANRHAMQAYGYGDSPVGRSVLDQYGEPQRRFDLVERLRSGGGVEQFETLIRSPEGEPRSTLISAQSIRYQDRDAVLAVSQDIDEIKRLERALKESEEQQRDILEAGPVGILIINRDDQVLFRNRWLSEMAGAGDDEELYF
jgi:PAS domain S-box-containing protein